MNNRFHLLSLPGFLLQEEEEKEEEEKDDDDMEPSNDVLLFLQLVL